MLKKIRVAFSLLFFIYLAFAFIDIKNYLPQYITDIFLYLQFFPSLFKFFEVFSFAAIGFVIILILTVFFGRIYCSSICPLGTLQDIIFYLRKKIIGCPRLAYSSAYTILRYSILIATILFVLLGSMYLINLLDPFSNFGRVFTHLIRPIYVSVNNGLVSIFEHFGNYSIYPVPLKHISVFSICMAVGFLILLSCLAITNARLYCNTVCPVGAILSIISKYSLVKINIDKKKCTTCNLCVSVCKAQCINSKNALVDMSRCINCFNCIAVCSKNSISYTIGTKPIMQTNSNYERRKFLLTLSSGIIGLSLLNHRKGLAQEVKPTAIKEKKHYPVTPPGSISLPHFTGHCTACHLCITACPTQVLQPAIFQYGLAGIFQPYMDFNTDYCTYDCTICSKVCPSGAILPITTETKKTIQTGKVVFQIKNCIVYTNNTDCGACSEHCPTKAVDMVAYKNNLSIPKVNTNLCVGCGACEYICPVRPYKAIYVDGNYIHQKALLPTKNNCEQKIDVTNDFPF